MSANPVAPRIAPPKATEPCPESRLSCRRLRFSPAPKKTSMSATKGASRRPEIWCWPRLSCHHEKVSSNAVSPSNQGDNRHAPANTPGIRHIAFAVEGIDAVVAGLRARGAELVGELERYEDSYRLCYVRGPEGIIIELAEQIG
jgi:hypothetical protein